MPENKVKSFIDPGSSRYTPTGAVKLRVLVVICGTEDSWSPLENSKDLINIEFHVAFGTFF